MKVFQIKGRLLVNDELVKTHEQMLEILYYALKSSNMYFAGETKDITDQFIIEDKIY